MERNSAQPTRRISTRLTRKGVLVEETRTALRHWDESLSVRDNVERLRRENPFGAPTEKWLNEITATLSARFDDSKTTAVLVFLAKNVVDDALWHTALAWQAAETDELYYRFCVEWLFPMYEDGTLVLTSTQLLPFVRKVTDGRLAKGSSLREYGAKRAARDLLRMASDLGLLEGHQRKRFRSYHLEDRGFLFVLHSLRSRGMGAKQIVEARDWRVFLMSQSDVERELLRLHQYGQLEYQAAGSVVHLRLPHSSPLEYVRSLTA